MPLRTVFHSGGDDFNSDCFPAMPGQGQGNCPGAAIHIAQEVFRRQGCEIRRSLIKLLRLNRVDLEERSRRQIELETAEGIRERIPSI